MSQHVESYISKFRWVDMSNHKIPKFRIFKINNTLFYFFMFENFDFLEILWVDMSTHSQKMIYNIIFFLFETFFDVCIFIFFKLINFVFPRFVSSYACSHYMIIDLESKVLFDVWCDGSESGSTWDIVRCNTFRLTSAMKHKI